MNSHFQIHPRLGQIEVKAQAGKPAVRVHLLHPTTSQDLDPYGEKPAHPSSGAGRGCLLLEHVVHSIPEDVH